MHGLQEIGPNEHKNMFAYLCRLDMLDEQARVFFTDPDDIITTSKTDRVFHLVIEKLLFTRVGKILLVSGIYSYQFPPPPRAAGGVIRRLTVSRYQTKGPFVRETDARDGEGRYQKSLNVTWVGQLVVIFIVLLSVFLLLSPALLLYLVPLTKAQSAGVAVSFVFTFTLCLSLVRDIRLDNVLVGVAALMAVLVTFLANLENNCSQA